MDHIDVQTCCGLPVYIRQRLQDIGSWRICRFNPKLWPDPASVQQSGCVDSSVVGIGKWDLFDIGNSDVSVGLADVVNDGGFCWRCDLCLRYRS